MEEARLDCLALEIVERKKEATARQLQSEENLAKEKEAVDALASIIRQTRQDSTVAFENEKKLKRDKLSKGGILSRAMRTFYKPSGPPQTLTSSSVSQLDDGGTTQVPPSPQSSSPARLPAGTGTSHPHSFPSSSALPSFGSEQPLLPLPVYDSSLDAHLGSRNNAPEENTRGDAEHQIENI